MAHVSLKNVSKIYPGDVTAVEEFSLEIATGEFVVLVGPSGCGKSTTLRMIAGLEEISSGTITIDGRVVNDVAPKDRDIAMVFQNYALYPHMTVYDNMAFALKLRKVSRAEIAKRVTEASAILGIEDLMKRQPKQLSGGQRQRVALGRAIVRDPKVFLFDEPLSNLDAKMRAHMRVEISKLHRRFGRTTTYVTHDQTEAMTMGDRIVVMKDGVVRQVATAGDLYDKPANLFVAGFIGTPPMNFFEGTLRAAEGSLCFDGASFELALPDAWSEAAGAYVGKRVIFGVRPEDILPDPAAGTEGFTANVEVAEPMGSETYVYPTQGAHNFVSRVDPHRECPVGGRLELRVRMERAHLFDTTTEETLV